MLLKHPGEIKYEEKVNPKLLLANRDRIARLRSLHASLSFKKLDIKAGLEKALKDNEGQPHWGLSEKESSSSWRQ